MSYPRSLLGVAFAALGLALAHEAFAGATCRNPDGTRFCSSTSSCPDGTTKVSSTCSTRSGGGSYGGSFTSLNIKFGNEVLTVDFGTDGLGTGTVCGSGFFDAATTPNLNTKIDCDFTDNFNQTTVAACTLNMTCSCFQIGGCPAKGKGAGLRTSQMKCPTLDLTGTQNLAGCTGSVLVEPTSGTDQNVLPTAVTLDIGGTAGLLDKSACGGTFFNDPGFLRKFIIGEIDQECTKETSPTDELVVADRLRGCSVEGPAGTAFCSPANFKVVTTVAGGLAAECSPSSVEGPGSCPDQGGLWIAVDGAGLAGIGVSVSAAIANPGTLRCSTNGPPSACRERDVNGDGVNELECRCPTCDGTQFLVSASSYQITQTSGDPQWTAACPVKVTP